jgi:lysophospholipase L1-like esterase
VQTWARSRGVGFVDLTPALTAAASRGELVYFPDDTHWSAAGNAVVAQALAEAPAIVHALAAPNRNAAVDASDRSGR